MSHLSTSIHVDAPPELVFDLAADPSRGPDWQTLIHELGEVSGRPGGVGSSYIGYYRVAGRKLEGHFIVTAAERPSLLQLAGTTRGGWTRWTTMVEPSPGGGSDVTVTLEYELPGEIVGNLFGVLTRKRMDHEFKRTYEKFKRVAELDAVATPGAADVEGHRTAVPVSIDRRSRLGPPNIAG